MEKQYLVCVRWGKQTNLIPCVMRLCSKCGEECAMDADNQQYIVDKGLNIMCAECWMREQNPFSKVVGAALGGKFVPLKIEEKK